MKRRIDIGLLYSRSGTYPLLGEACRAGALAAVAEVNADPDLPFAFAVNERDPEGRIDAYAPLAAELLAGGARHIVGCITSWSRKEVIPVLERQSGLLWYATPYEGFEASDHVVYLHACPNQHLVPLIAHVLPRFGRRGFLVGSNYIWGWEMNRVARDLVTDAGGEVLGERHLPLGDTDVARIVEEIRAAEPDFVLNNLIGPSSYAFFEAYAALGRADPRFAASRRPILSCNLTECELPALGGSGEGHLSCGPFFHAPGLPASSFTAAAHAAVTVLAQAVARSGSERPEAVAAAFGGAPFDTVLGALAIDPRTRHASLPVKIGRIRGAGFEVLEASAGALAPDPYLSRYDPRAAFAAPGLRLVR